MTPPKAPGGAPTPPSSATGGPLPPARSSSARAGGEPTEAELVAIVAAVEMAWPRPMAAVEAEERPGPWRFSGRWWSKPHTVQRVRPWVERL
jgi:hypothetical protein